METQSVHAKLKGKRQYTCRGGSDCTDTRVALKGAIYSLHVYGEKKRMTVAKPVLARNFNTYKWQRLREKG